MIVTMTIDVNTKGLPLLGVGGGSYTSTIEAQIVLRKGEVTKLSPSGYYLPKPYFVRTHGNLSCQKDQASVVIRDGDFVVNIQGPKPFIMNNPKLALNAVKIIGVDLESKQAAVKMIEIPRWLLPDIFSKRISRGIGIYHNRDGIYFCQANVPKGKCEWCVGDLGGKTICECGYVPQ